MPSQVNLNCSSSSATQYLNYNKQFFNSAQTQMQSNNSSQRKTMNSSSVSMNNPQDPNVHGHGLGACIGLFS